MTTLSASIRRYRWMFFLAALSVLAVTAIATNTTAWTTEDVNFTNDDGESGRVQDSNGIFYKQPLTNTTGYTRMGIGSTYWGYMSVPIDQFDDMTYIKSASIYFYSYGLTSPSGYLDVQLLTLDPRYAGAVSIWQHIDSSIDIGRPSIQLYFYQYYSVTITGKALDIVRERIEDGEAYLTIGFASYYGSAFVYQRFSDLHSYIRFQYDDSAPEIPTLDAMDIYSTGDTLPVSWSSSSDLPTGANVGGVEYQLGMFLNVSDTGYPWYMTQWSSNTSWDLFQPEDARAYHFRVRARDGSGFTSNWSTPVNTTVDNSPPGTPLLYPEPAYTNGTNNTIIWWPCLDAGVGNVSYEYQYAFVAGFPVNIRLFTRETFVNITDLQDWTYYYRVRSVDGLGHASPWSPVERSTQDSTPPSVPMVMEEPEYTAGSTNVFNWHPSYDIGFGGVIYYYQIATSPSFANDTIHAEYPTELTTIGTAGLVDGQTYYFRVAAIDGFGYQSEWSDLVWSAQDGSPPTAPMIYGLSPLPEGWVTITWAPAIDHGVGVSHYEVWWYKEGPPGSSPMVASIDVIGHSLTLPDLTNGTWHFGATAVDRFGQRGPGSDINITIDGTPPTRPVLEELPEFTKGTSITLRWNSSTDDSGIDFYRVIWRPSTIFASGNYFDTHETVVTLVDLTDGVLYWYQVYAYDKAGNFASSSSEKSRQDASPPPAPYLHHQSGIKKRDYTVIEWSPVTDNNENVVEYQLRGRVIFIAEVTSIEFPWTSDLNLTLEGLSENAFYLLHVVARDSLGWVSEPSNEVSFDVDLTPPVVEIWTPTEGQVITGTLMIDGQFKDVRPNVYFIEYRSASQEEWQSIVYWTENVNPPQFYEPWDTSGLPDGDYVIRVTHVDDIGWQGYDEVNVTLANAHPTVSPTDIGFAVPGVGDATMVMVAVRNDGDAMARNLTVKFYDNSLFVESRTGVDIEAHSFHVLYFELNETGKRYIEVSVGSDLYDTQSGGRFLVAEEEPEVEEVSEDDPAQTLAILALVLAVIALLIALMMVVRPPPKVPGRAGNVDNVDSMIEVADDWEETPSEGT